MTIPAQQDQSNMKRGADLLVRGLWLSSFSFLEIIWKTQREEILESSLVIKDKRGRNSLRLLPLFSNELHFRPHQCLSHTSYLKALQTKDACSANSFIPNKAP